MSIFTTGVRCWKDGYIKCWGANFKGPPDAEGYAYWLALVESAEISRGDVMLYFAESQEYRNITGT